MKDTFTFNNIRHFISMTSISLLFSAIQITSGYTQTVIIGTQEWTNSNLDVSKFRNGDEIPLITNEEDWTAAGNKKQPASCYFNFDAANGPKFGKMYNWYAISDPRGIAPNGWHVPSEAEWEILIEFLGGGGFKQGGVKLKSTSGWKENRNGTNSVGFNALPGGIKSFYQSFEFLTEKAGWWSTKSIDDVFGWLVLVHDEYSIVTMPFFDKPGGAYIRLLKD